jgi:antagonist of KipI
MSITILKPGFMSSVQDLGRWGYQQFGVPIGGAMDVVSASIANRICGNDNGEALLECTLHGVEILFNKTTLFAIAGGGASATVNGQPISFYKLIKVVAGSTLKLHPDPIGCRSYVAFAGGLKIEAELGSTSTYSQSSIGGYHGKNLNAGIVLELKHQIHHLEKSKDIVINEHGLGISNWKSKSFNLPHVQETITITCLAGPEWDAFDEKSQHQLFNTPFIVSAQSNRMGFRLEGPILSLKEKTEMVSTAVTRGIIQVTNQGNPIILMADAQTIGGYPRIGRVCSDDISLLAQCRPGQKIMFKEVGGHDTN